MKKKIAFLLLAILTTAVTLAACNQAAITEKYIRWETEGEQYSFHVTLATDFNAQENKSTQTIEGNSVEFTKELSLSGENLANRDELKPEAVDGTYSMNISKSDPSHWQFATEQTLYAQYKTTDLKLNGQELSELTASGEEVSATSLTEKEGYTILKSVINQSVVFEDTSSQTPTSSKVESNGFYIGEAQQQQSKYTLETTYDFSGKRPLVKVTVDGETTEYKMARNAKFIDPNQLLLYLRSYNKSSTDFQDNPSVAMFNPFTGQLETTGFALSHNTPLIVTDNNKETSVKYASLNAVSVVVGGYSYMVEENVPDSVDADKMVGSSDKSKYTTVRFRVGYLSYELEKYPDEIWNALKYIAQ